MLRVNIMARSAVPCIGALRPHAIHRTYAMDRQIQDSRRYGRQREREEEQAAVKDGVEVWPCETHLVILEYRVLQKN